MPNTGPDSTQVIALIAPFNCKGQVLLLKRNKDQHCGGLWSFPGGKVEINESSQQAAIRELQEETGLSGSQWQKLGETAYSYPDRSLKLMLFSCLCPDISDLHSEAEHLWIDSAKLENYPMPEANARLLPMLNTHLEEKS
jgi:8-oxo-dGTP diphosphatase